MDIINFFNSENKDIVISLPKDKTWLEYLGYFLDLKSTSGYVEVILPSVPTTQPGNKCYIIYDEHLKGCMEISRITENESGDICISLIPYLYSMPNLPMDEIDGFKYFLDNSDTQ